MVFTRIARVDVMWLKILYLRVLNVKIIRKLKTQENKMGIVNPTRECISPAHSNERAPLSR